MSLGLSRIVPKRRIGDEPTRNPKRCSRGRRQLIPGGVNSPVRAFRSVGGKPPFIARGEGSPHLGRGRQRVHRLRRLLGAAAAGPPRIPAIIEALAKALEIGTSFGAPTEQEIELAEAICDAVPSIEMVRLVNSGTEATMSAIRLARGFTGRDIIVKFEGCYHGHVDSLLVKAGSGVATLGIAGYARRAEGSSATPPSRCRSTTRRRVGAGVPGARRRDRVR